MNKKMDKDLKIRSLMIAINKILETLGINREERPEMAKIIEDVTKIFFVIGYKAGINQTKK